MARSLPMRTPQQHQYELEREGRDRLVRGLDAAQQHGIGVRHDGLRAAREPEPESCLAGRVADTFVGLAVRVGDRCERPRSGVLELCTSGRHRPREGGFVERREEVVAQRVEAHVEAALDELAHVLGAQARIMRVGPEAPREPLSYLVSLLRAHGLDALSDLVNVSTLDGELELRIHCTLEALPPERMRPVEGRPTEEEGRRGPRAPQNGPRQPHVRDEVVVEREGDRKALAAPARRDCALDVLGGHETVARAEVPELGLEDGCVVRPHELIYRVASLRCERVVDEHHPRPPRRKAKHGRKGACEGQQEERAETPHAVIYASAGSFSKSIQAGAGLAQASSVACMSWQRYDLFEVAEALPHRVVLVRVRLPVDGTTKPRLEPAQAMTGTREVVRVQVRRDHVGNPHRAHLRQ